MDSRCIFLHYYITELWGHGNGMPPGMESRNKERTGMGGKSPMQREALKFTEMKVGKRRKGPSRQAAIAYIIPVP